MVQHMTLDVARRHTLSCKDVAHEAQTVAELVLKSDGLAGMVTVTAKKKKKKEDRAAKEPEEVTCSRSTRSTTRGRQRHKD